MSSHDHTNRPSSLSRGRSASISHVGRPPGKNTPNVPMAPPGLLEPYTPTRARTVPLAQTTHHQRADSDDSTDEGETTAVEDQLAAVWAETNITKLKRREQIISRARGIVSDYVEAQGKYKEVMGAPYDNILLATAMWGEGLATIYSHVRSQPNALGCP